MRSLTSKSLLKLSRWSVRFVLMQIITCTAPLHVLMAQCLVATSRGLRSSPQQQKWCWVKWVTWTSPASSMMPPVIKSCRSACTVCGEAQKGCAGVRGRDEAYPTTGLPFSALPQSVAYIQVLYTSASVCRVSLSRVFLHYYAWERPCTPPR